METLERLPEQGPLLEETMLSAGLDYYKLTMSQLQYEKHPDAEVTFTFKNRGEQRVADYVDSSDLQARLDFVRERGWSDYELNYFASLTDPDNNRLFTDEFIDYLGANKLPQVVVALDPESNDLAIATTGKWPLVTFWETIVMSEVSELYFNNYVGSNGLDLHDVYVQGERRFDEKVEYLQTRPDVRVAEFGTRRRFSLRWQKEVVERLKDECPDNLVGTSNLALAATENLTPIGTFAHELPMVYAGLADYLGTDIRMSHRQMLNDWIERYPSLGIALSDTFGSDFFFEDFTPEQARAWNGTRHDSGDAIKYGEKAIRKYKDVGIDPEDKTVVFSDSLKISREKNTVEPIRERFAGKLQFLLGVGTDFSNDLGLAALNQVMKATEVNGVPTVKLSDDAGKHTGPDNKVRLYQEIFGGTK